MVAGVTGAWTTDVIEAAHQRDVQACTPADGAEAPQPGTIAIFKGEAAPKSFNEDNDEVKGLDWSLRTKSPIECFPSTAKAFTVRRALLPLFFCGPECRRTSGGERGGSYQVDGGGVEVAAAFGGVSHPPPPPPPSPPSPQQVEYVMEGSGSGYKLPPVIMHSLLGFPRGTPRW